MPRRYSSRRAPRTPRFRLRKATPAIIWVIDVAAVLGSAATAVGLQALMAPRTSARDVSQVETVAVATPAPQTVAPSRVEVPGLSGLSLTEAETVLAAAGLGIRVRSTGVDSETGSLLVASQDPAAGVLAEVPSTVTVVVRSGEPATNAAQSRTADEKPSRQSVVCIDPGHQARADSTPEPIGPGSTTVKPSVTGGATGTTTRVPESEIALQVSMNLKSELEARGIKVVMTRTTNDVNLSNSQRAQIANDAKADLFVRIHGDGSPDSSSAGLSTLFPGKNKWTEPICADSKEAAGCIQSATVRSTGAVDRGIKARVDLSGFNWSKVPSVLVECGFLSNPVEDRLLASPHYQDKLASGIADGVVEYLESGE